MLFQTDMTTDKRIEDLFQKYFDKTAKEEERLELMHLINETGSDDELLLLIENAYRNYVPGQNPFGTGRREKMLQQIHSVISGMEKVEAPVRIYKKIQWFRYAAAASVLLFVAIGIYFFGLNERKLAKIDFNPGGNKATLTLSNGATINLDDAKNGQVASQGEIAINKTHDGEVNYDASHLGKNVSAGYNKIATPKGGQYKVVLADGTKAWLNSVSSISFPTAFDGKERHVEITGEVYFEVAKNKKQPFFVKAGKQIVEVLGTHFNINSYTDEPDIKTTLLEGSVKVKQLNTGLVALLKPGQQSISESTGPILIHDADIEQAIAWKNGLFQINNANIETIMRQAARWYDVDIAYEGKIPERKFSGKIKRNVKASEFLQMLTYFNVKFSIEGRKIIVKN